MSGIHGSPASQSGPGEGAGPRGPWLCWTGPAAQSPATASPDWVTSHPKGVASKRALHQRRKEGPRHVTCLMGGRAVARQILSRRRARVLTTPPTRPWSPRPRPTSAPSVRGGRCASPSRPSASRVPDKAQHAGREPWVATDTPAGRSLGDSPLTCRVLPPGTAANRLLPPVRRSAGPHDGPGDAGHVRPAPGHPRAPHRRLRGEHASGPASGASCQQAGQDVQVCLRSGPLPCPTSAQGRVGVSLTIKRGAAKRVGGQSPSPLMWL